MPLFGHCQESDSCVTVALQKHAMETYSSRSSRNLSQMHSIVIGMTVFLLIPGSSVSWPDYEKKQRATRVRLRTKVFLRRTLGIVVEDNP